MKPHYNHGLFSNYYLDELLPREDEFKTSQSPAQKVFNNIKGLWSSVKEGISSLNEDQLRKHFLDRVFEMFGWTVDVEPPIPSGEWSKHPDYSLFPDRNKLQIAQKAPKEEYFKQALCIGEAKRWGRPLDKKLKVEKDPFEVQNPSLQISRYLWLTEVKWGILTDGKYWRLYERETSKRLDIYYEVDLEELLENGSPEDFRYFYLFFGKEFFPAFIEKVYKESVDYAQAVGKELKENVYEALRVLAEGFLKAPENNLTETSLKEIYDNSLILLYRLLFILYAEYRGLLPLGDNKFYTESYSLNALKKEIAEKLDKNEPLAMSTFGYWNRLKELFEVINKGNIELAVPPYNGGLFDPERLPFLEKYKIGDSYIARAIDLISRTQDKAYIDYGSLEIRHLGSIYEGLLEYKLKMAEDDVVPIKEKGKEVFISLAEAQRQKKKIKPDDMVRRGEVYLATDKGERKATGSYFTPHYIVQYIVENTLGPLIEEKRKKIADRLREIKEKIKKTRGYNREFYEKELHKVEGGLLDEVLSIKVLDPAMGSGHFLVEATDFLARELLRILSGEPLEDTTEQITIKDPSEYYGPKELEEPEEDIRWARREVVERCIFGVDLNPLAVELAKLSLWLYTVAKGKPLNFLDHHLKCGNSLIGAWTETLNTLPQKPKKAKKVPITQLRLPLDLSPMTVDLGLAVGDYLLIESKPTEKITDIKEKERILRELNEIRINKWRDIANIWTNCFFGLDLDPKIYRATVDYILNKEKRLPDNWVKNCLDKSGRVAGEKYLFHWELEFPEIFFDKHGKKLADPGFNVVIGNPPYIMELRENKHLFRELQNSPLGRKYYESKMDIFYFFIELGIDLLKEKGSLGFIVQEYWISRTHASKLRKKLFEDTTPTILVDFKRFQVFKDATGQHNMIVILEKSEGKGKTVILSLKDSDVKEEDVINALTLEPKRQDVFEVRKRKTSELYDTKIDKVYLSGEEDPDLQTKLASKGFKLKEREIQQGLVTPQHYLTSKSLSKLSDPINHQPGEGIFVLSISELKKFKLTKGEREILKPFHYAEELDKFDYTSGARYYLIYTPKQTARDIEENPSKYPNIKAHLDKYQQVITSDNKPYGIHRARQSEWFEDPQKIIGVRKTKYPKFVVVPEPYYMDQSILIIRLTIHKKYSPYFVCPILNSRVAHFWFFQQKRQGEQLQIDKEVLLRFPIRRIAFVTPKAERERLVEEFKGLYYDLMKDISGEKELGLVNGGNLLKSIEERLQKNHQPDLELVKKHNTDPLNKDWQVPEGALWEQSDVVHDILAFLAEQMIELNKEKQSEIKGFLEWMEEYIGVKVDELKNKTRIKAYFKSPWEEFREALKQNKGRIKKMDISRREPQEKVKAEYEASMAKLTPLLLNIKATDKLIDQIVYRLYGLTEEEIRIVEESK